MKKFIFIFAALFLGLSQANAQEIYVDNFTAPEGGVMKFDVKYRGIGDKTIQGYIFKFEFPEGLSLVTEDDIAIFEYGEGNTSFDVKTTATGVQASPKSKTSQLAGNEGTLVTLTLQVNDPLAQGDVATVKVYDASLTQKVVNTDGTSSYKDLDTNPFTFDVTIGEDRVIFNEADTRLPAYTAGEKKNVRMTRTIKAESWSTIVLPFTLTKTKAEEAFGTDVKLAEFTGFDTEYSSEEDITPDAITIKFTTYTMNAKKGMTGGKPFLIKTSADVESFEAEEVQLVDAVADVTMADEYETSGKFTGSFVKTVVPADGLFINSEKFYYSTGKTNIKAFRGWFDLKAVLDKDTDFGAKIGFTIDGDATDIDGIPSYQRVTEGVYDLSGRKIQLQDGDLNKLQKGVYIIDGKKVTIK